MEIFSPTTSLPNAGFVRPGTNSIKVSREISIPTTMRRQCSQDEERVARSIGRDAACLFRSNEQKDILGAAKLASRLINLDCPARLQPLAVEEFNLNVPYYAIAKVNDEGGSCQVAVLLANGSRWVDFFIG